MAKQSETWNALSADQEKIVALNSEIDKLKDSNLKLSKAVKNRGHRTGTRNNRTRGEGGGTTTGCQKC